MKIEHILVTTDLSDESLRPCEWAAELARASGARITLLHVVPELSAIPYGAPLAGPQPMPDLGDMIERAQREAEEQRKSLPADLDVKVEVISADGVAKAVARYAQQNDVDLIAMSTHGRTGFRHLALGSVAESVLRHSHLPVLCFPRK